MNSWLLYVSIIRVGCSFVIKRNPRVVDVLDDFRSLSKLMNSFVSEGVSEVPSKTKAMQEAKEIDSLKMCSHFLCWSVSTFVDITYIHTYIVYIHSLFGNAGYKIRKTEVLMWTCLSTY